jgi:selenoprotein W-related protein
MIYESLGIQPTLIKGRGGVFDIAVDGETVIGKVNGAFPEDEAVVAAIKRALST